MNLCVHLEPYANAYEVLIHEMETTVKTNYTTCKAACVANVSPLKDSQTDTIFFDNVAHYTYAAKIKTRLQRLTSGSPRRRRQATYAATVHALAPHIRQRRPNGTLRL